MSVPVSVDLLHCSLLFALPQVYHLLPLKESQGYSFRDYYLEEDNVNPCVSLDNLSLNGFLYVPISSDGEGDAYNILKVSTSLSFFPFVPFSNSVSSLLFTCFEGLFNKKNKLICCKLAHALMQENNQAQFPHLLSL